ncbi:hypothetical protein [Desemzia sp. FAM 24101]|uniref:hypothetical protein n=1 Tax=Desemzia sp. FAM 24101 TaxID=3259522 RepID=UPI003888F8F0
MSIKYKISPYKEIKEKHRDRSGVVKSFIKIEDKSELKVHLQFSNNNNFGWVDAQDLVSL